MSVFTLAISRLITSNLPWFMDLTFQVSMQYCSLQHQILLSPPDTSTTGCLFWFDSASSFLLELFLHSSPVAYWAPMDLGSSSFNVISLCLSTVPGILKEGMPKWFILWFVVVKILTVLKENITYKESNILKRNPYWHKVQQNVGGISISRSIGRDLA